MHHAYLLVGERDQAEKFLHTFWEKRGVKLVSSPDFFIWREDLFGIEEARNLSVQASRKAFTERQIFLISPERISLEAQNALLKTFEDPKENTYFFLLVREEELVLPTLRSRMEMIRLRGEEEGGRDAENFLALPYKERLVFARKFADAEENLSVFLDKLLHHMREKQLTPQVMRTVYEVRRYSDDRAASSRLILEHLALVL